MPFSFSRRLDSGETRASSGQGDAQVGRIDQLLVEKKAGQAFEGEQG